MNVDLLFVGDSVTYGMELEPEHEKYRFSNLVATDKNLTHHNRSLSGACNDWIVKTAVNFFREGNTCETAIIQFSAPTRWNFYDAKTEKFYNVGARKTVDNFITPRMEAAHTAYYESIYTRELANENYWKNVFFLDHYLKDKCDTIYLTLGYHIPHNDWTPDVEIGSVKLIVGDSRTIGHPTKEGHRKIANHILSKF
tara:strand:+ start:219 stop:809 length:591 start_codon:yes stop_codon:yes gene_type:complete